MGFSVRQARRDDIASIVPWTTDTFAWGDYVPERIGNWIDAESSAVLVCVSEDDEPRAVAHVTLLSPHEAWLEGARVHPDYRRRGLGSMLNDAGTTWSRQRDARVIRLATEAENAAARSQVEGLSYRKVSSWLYGEFSVEPHRCRPRHELRPAPGSDAEAAWLSWAASDLALAGRELMALGWQWRTARPDDVTRAAAARMLFQSPGGWVAIDQPDRDFIQTTWISTSPEDLLGILDGLLSLAHKRQAEELTVKLPNLPWTEEAVSRYGGEPREVLVYSKPL